MNIVDVFPIVIVSACFILIGGKMVLDYISFGVIKNEHE